MLLFMLTLLNTKADKSNSYTKTEIKAFIETQYTFAAPFTKTVNTTTGIFTIGLNSNTPINNTLTAIIYNHHHSMADLFGLYQLSILAARLLVIIIIWILAVLLRAMFGFVVYIMITSGVIL